MMKEKNTLLVVKKDPARKKVLLPFKAGSALTQGLSNRPHVRGNQCQLPETLPLTHGWMVEREVPSLSILLMKGWEFPFVVLPSKAGMA
jgi:hypothetical protein